MLSPMSFSLLRVVLAAPCLLALAALEREPDGERRPVLDTSRRGGRSWRFLLAVTAALGVIFAGLFNWLLFFGNKFAGAGTSAAMQPGVPVYTAILGVLLGLERVSLGMALGILSTVAGSLVMAEVWNLSVSSGREAAGVVMLLVQGLCWALYTVAIEWIVVRRRETTSLKAYALTMTWGVPLNLLVGLPFIVHTAWGALSAAGWIGILYGSVLVQVIAMALYSYAVSRVSGSIAACYMGIQVRPRPPPARPGAASVSPWWLTAPRAPRTRARSPSPASSSRRGSAARRSRPTRPRAARSSSSGWWWSRGTASRCRRTP